MTVGRKGAERCFSTGCAWIDDCVHVSDLDCVVGCRRLVEREAVLSGGSSGGVVAAAERYWHRFPAGTICVMILPDRGERYLDTIYDDDWVREHLPEYEAEKKKDDSWILKTATPLCDEGKGSA